MNCKYLYITNLIILVIFIIIPLDYILLNFEYTFPILPKFFFIYFVNIILILFLNCLFYFFLKKILNKKIFINTLFFILIWIIINGLFFPSIGFKSEFWETVSDIRLRYQLPIKFLLCFSIFLIFSKILFFKRNLKKIFLIYFSIILITNIIIISLKFQKPKESVNLNTFGKENFLVISFDGINGSILENLINNTNSYQSDFKDFTLYSNYTTYFPTTRFSLKSELTPLVDLKEVNNEDLLINDKKIIDKVYTYGVYNELFLGNNKIYQGSFFSQDRTFFLINLYRSYVLPTFSRWMTNFVYDKFNNYYLNKNKSLFVFITKILSFNFFNSDNFDNERYYNDIHRISILELDEIFNSFSYDNNISTKNIFFSHFSFSHYRIRHDQNCNLIKYENLNKFQSHDGNLEITKCVIKKMNFIVNKLKEEKVYDHTTIIFKADHGKPIGYFENKYLNMKINNNIRWGPGRYNSFFMVKKNNQDNPKILIKDKMILSSDIYNYYCNNIPVRIECSKYTNDLIYIPMKKNTFQNINEFEKFKIDRKEKLFIQLLKQNKLN